MRIHRSIHCSCLHSAQLRLPKRLWDCSSGPLKSLRYWVQYWSIWLGIYVAHTSGQDVRHNIGESGGGFKCPTQVVDIFSGMLVNLVRYLHGPLKWLRSLVQYW